MESQLQNPEDRVAGPRSPLLENGRRTLTAKGRATRQRIIDAAARVMVEAGPDGARLEDIQAEARVSVSQVYHYFRDKDALILAVVDHQTEVVLGAHRPVLERLDSFERLEEWRDMIVAGLEAQRCIGGCPVGSLASSLAESHPIARTALANSFARWEALLRDGLARMRDQGALRADIDVDSLALGTLAAVQGGLLLSQTRRDTSSVRIAVDNAIALLRTLSP